MERLGAGDDELPLALPVADAFNFSVTSSNALSGGRSPTLISLNSTSSGQPPPSRKGGGSKGRSHLPEDRRSPHRQRRSGQAWGGDRGEHRASRCGMARFTGSSFVTSLHSADTRRESAGACDLTAGSASSSKSSGKSNLARTSMSAPACRRYRGRSIPPNFGRLMPRGAGFCHVFGGAFNVLVSYNLFLHASTPGPRVGAVGLRMR